MSRCFCYDCKRPYGDEYGFPDLLLQKFVWTKISPKKNFGGLLCPSCIIKRLGDLGLENVPACFVSGPLKMISEEKMKRIYNVRM